MVEFEYYYFGNSNVKTGSGKGQICILKTIR